MPKMKTRRAIAKRFHSTGRGKVRHAQASRSHLLTARSRKRKRNLRRPAFLGKADEKRVKRVLPYL